MLFAQDNTFTLLCQSLHSQERILIYAITLMMMMMTKHLRGINYSNADAAGRKRETKF
jgi:hypothetical protein